MAEISLELRNIKKSFTSEESVLNNIDLTIEKGEFITLLGSCISELCSFSPYECSGKYRIWTETEKSSQSRDKKKGKRNAGTGSAGRIWKKTTF